MAKVATTVLIVILSYYLKASMMGKDKNISSNQIIIPRFDCRSKSTVIYI